MPGYETRKLNVRVGLFKAKIRALSDHNQTEKQKMPVFVRPVGACLVNYGKQAKC